MSIRSLDCYAYNQGTVLTYKRGFLMAGAARCQEYFVFYSIGLISTLVFGGATDDSLTWADGKSDLVHIG